ncbi:RBBP9/YdeN family alpha/beta hydrolase [Streptomyces mangrovisoli]|uniref:Alpha/beta hydrolase n=1 Tax=Streptomyces mangrovisoli TaxID=1428628 RepID=A0A1J4NVC3_9ACTN|nr:alpha/beta hydrolase [Streptomyces mangrovisoli]OIJ65110.1 alpha/beta hydrolase [Streptomyces mangrovisoli]
MSTTPESTTVTVPEPTTVTVPEPTVVVVPGLRDHVADHWQTLLADRLVGAGRAVATVPPPPGDRLDLDARIAALDATISAVDGPVLLVAHSAGCATTVHWALRHRADVVGTRADVVGALLATPPDLETPLPAGHPAPGELAEHGWTPVPRALLPFPAVVAVSSDDPLGEPERVTELARAWGAETVELGPVGHLNPASGYGEWPRAEELIRALEHA